jgi:hypothetical protein
MVSGQPHNAGMKTWLLLSLAFLPIAVAAAAGRPTAVAPAPATVLRAPTQAPATAPRPPLRTVTVHRCTDARGRVTLQDDPCPPGSQDSSREMLRPKDPPVTAKKTQALPPPLYEPLPEPPLPMRELIPPPAMYRCTSYDGIERYSEQYDPNPRCEPYVLYYPYPNLLTPAQALTCRWVEDSCVRLSDRAACERWKSMKKEAVSALQRAFSDTAEYRKSELERFTQIVEDSCP